MGWLYQLLQRRAAIRRDHRALIGDGEDDVRVVRVDPDASDSRRRPARRARRVHVSAAVLACATSPSTRCRRRSGFFGSTVRVGRSPPPMRASGRGSSCAASAGAPAPRHREEPVLAAVGGLVEADDPVASPVGRRRPATIGVEDASDCSARSRCSPGGSRGSPSVSCFQVVPPSVDLKMPVAGAAESLALDEALLLLPERGVDDVRVARIDADVVAARVLVLVQHLLERACRRRSSGRRRARRWARTDGRARRRRGGRGCADRRRSSRSSGCRAGRDAVQVFPASVDL